MGIMKLRTVLLAAALLAGPTFAQAEGVTTSVKAGVTTDYIWRGLSQSNNQASMFAGVDIGTDLVYLGAWAGQVKYDTANLETDLYAGVKPAIGPVTFDLGVIGYMYPDDTDLNTYEGKLGATYNFANGITAGVAVYHANEVGKDGPKNTYTEATFGVPFKNKIGPFNVGMTTSVGYNDPEEGDTYYNAKVAFAGVTEGGWGVEIGATSTDIDKSSLSIHDAKFSANKGYLTLSKAF
jgi:uncharacterized protein (TIGR02001 family)